MIITLPSDSHIHHISSTFFLTFTYPFTLHFTFVTYSLQNPKTPPYPYIILLKKEEEEGNKRRRKVKRNREIRSEKKENKWENIFYHHLYHLPYPSPSTSFGSIIIISGTFFVFKSTLFICIFAFNHVIPLEILSCYFLQPPHTMHPKDRNPFELHSL